MIDKSGLRFGRLLVLNRIPRREMPHSHNAMWRCQCDCGETVTVAGANLGTSQVSCGCYRREASSARLRTHGLSSTAEFSSWSCMIHRCNSPDDISYPNYGARGIKVCPEWVESFEAFYRDMGQKPSHTFSIERRDNSLGYSKSNCYWASKHTQMRNMRTNHRIEINGETSCIADWCYRIQIDRRNIYRDARTKRMTIPDFIKMRLSARRRD